MKSFGIAMVVLGAFVGLMGLYFALKVPDTSSWTCIVEQGATSSTCSYNAGEADESNPGAALKSSTAAIAFCVVGAGMFAGGLAAAAGANHPVARGPVAAGFPPPAPGAPYPPAGVTPPPPGGYGR